MVERTGRGFDIGVGVDLTYRISLEEALHLYILLSDITVVTFGKLNGRCLAVASGLVDIVSARVDGGVKVPHLPEQICTA